MAKFQESDEVIDKAILDFLHLQLERREGIFSVPKAAIAAGLILRPWSLLYLLL